MKRDPKNAASTPINKAHHLLQTVKTVLTTHRLVPYGGCVIVGVSGGPDSTALLDILYQLRHELGLRLIVAHFNHRIRKEAGKDEVFVKHLAEKLELPFFCERAKHKPPVVGSLEDWARKLRYDFLIQLAAKCKADAVALAHTSDDLAETVLMRVIRGSGLQGLKGMGEKRVIHPTVIIRPMLGVRKKEIYAYLKKKKLDFCFDKTNAQTDYFRNKIRLKLMPYLEKEYNNNMTGALVNLSRSSSDDYEYIYQQARGYWQKVIEPRQPSVQGIRLKAASLCKLHPAIRRMIIRMAFEHLKGDLNQLTFEHVQRVEQLLENPTGRVELPAGIVSEKNKDCLIFRTVRLKS